MVLASVAPEGRTAIPRGRTSLRRTPVAPDISRPDLLALDPAGSPLPGDRHANARPDDIDELRVKKEGSEGFPSLPSHHPAQGTNFNRWFLERQFAACGGHRGWAPWTLFAKALSFRASGASGLSPSRSFSSSRHSWQQAAGLDRPDAASGRTVTAIFSAERRTVAPVRPRSGSMAVPVAQHHCGAAARPPPARAGKLAFVAISAA